MFMNKVEMPVALKKTKILLDSLPSTHMARAVVENDYKIKLSGFHGEQNTAYYLGFLQRDYYRIYHSMRFPTLDGRHFQMDFVIGTPHFITIIEVKNHTDEITFDTTFNQLIRRFKGKEDCFGSPLEQVLRQRFHLNKFLENNHFYGIPIGYLVVFSHTNCILKTDNKEHPLQKELPSQKTFPIASKS